MLTKFRWQMLCIGVSLSDSLAILIASGLFTLLHLTDSATFFLTEVAYSIPSYSILGIVLGYSYTKFDSEKTIQSVRAPIIKKRHLWYFSTATIIVIVAFTILSNYQESLQPASFTASGIHFVTSGGIITVIANITNVSTFSLIQIDASINGIDDGICGYGIGPGHTMACNFFSPSRGRPSRGMRRVYLTHIILRLH